MFDAFRTPDNVLVVGGSSDIGLEIAKALAKRGSSNFLLAGRNIDQMASCANDISSASKSRCQVAVVHYDASHDNSHSHLLAAAKDELKTLDYAIFAVGLLGDQLNDEKDAAKAKEILDINFTTQAMAILEVANYMKEQGFGQIVVISSVAGVRVRRSNFIYGAAKAGLDGFSMALGDALAGSGVGITVVRPGFVKTKMTSHLSAAPLSTDARAVAKATLRATDTEKSSIYIPFAIGIVAGIYRHLPRKIARRVPF